MWKQIKGFEDLYQINEYGDIVNVSGDTIHSYISNKGYKIVTLFKDGQKHKFLVHRLVAESFVSNPNNYPIVLHLDNNKLNNYYKNLKWGTYSENNSQAIQDGIKFLTIPDNVKYYEVYKDDDIIICRGAVEVMKLLGCSESVVRNLLFRKTCVNSGEYKGYKVRKATKEITKPIYKFKRYE